MHPRIQPTLGAPVQLTQIVRDTVDLEYLNMLPRLAELSYLVQLPYLVQRAVGLLRHLAVLSVLVTISRLAVIKYYLLT